MSILTAEQMVMLKIITVQEMMKMMFIKITSTIPASNQEQQSLIVTVIQMLFLEKLV